MNKEMLIIFTSMMILAKSIISLKTSKQLLNTTKDISLKAQFILDFIQ